MMEPGFYNMDCMEAMRQFEDKFFDLAIVDPPYGVGSVTYMPRTRKKAFGGYVDQYEIQVTVLDINQRAKVKTDVVHHGNTKGSNGGFGDANSSPAPEYFEELFRVSKNQIIWGGNYFLLPPSRGFVIWEKTTVSDSFSMAMCEFAWMSMNTNAKLFKSAPQGTASSPRIHPTQKPVALYTWILNNYAKPGDKILDTHVGSASSLIACHQMGFEYWGFEIDEEYYQKAYERLERERNQVNIFEGDAALTRRMQVGMDV